ncbi:unnamed protein product, partial [Gulo gulo]
PTPERQLRGREHLGAPQLLLSLLAAGKVSVESGSVFKGQKEGREERKGDPLLLLITAAHLGSSRVIFSLSAWRVPVGSLLSF